MAEHRIPRIMDREDEYRRLRLRQKMSPERNDPFADGRFHFSSFHPVYSYVLNFYSTFIQEPMFL